MKVYSSSGDPLVISDTPMSKGGEGCVFKIPGLNKYWFFVNLGGNISSISVCIK